MNIRWLQARQTKYAAYATVYILVILAIISVANVLAQNRYNKSYDSTLQTSATAFRNRLPKSSRDCPKPATITFYDKQSNFANAKDLLDRYTTLSPKVRANYVDPDKSPEQARAAGVTKYGTTMVEIGAKKEEAKSLSEEAVTGAIIRDLKTKAREVCFITGSGEPQIDDSGRDGFSRSEGRSGQGQLHDQDDQSAGEAWKSRRGLHGGSGCRPQKRLFAARRGRA